MLPNIDIKLVINVKDGSFDIVTAIPCGLIINELLTTSIKHTFPNDNDGEIRIELHSYDKNQYELIFSDDGVGLPENIDFENTDTLGMQMVNSLVKQIDGYGIGSVWEQSIT